MSRASRRGIMRVGQMELTRQQALAILGLPPSASNAEAERAYVEHKRPLKRKLVRAPSVEVKNACRRRLRELVEARDAVLGGSTLEDRRTELVISEGPLLASLRFERLDRALAFGILGLNAGSGEDEILEAYTVRYRFLTRMLARARDDERLDDLRQARMTLLGVRRFLLEGPADPTRTYNLTEVLDLTDIEDDFIVDDDLLDQVDRDVVDEEQPPDEILDDVVAREHTRAEQPEEPVVEFHSDETDDVTDDETDDEAAPARPAPDRGLAETLWEPFQPIRSLEETVASPSVREEDDAVLAGDAARVTAEYRRLLRPLREALARAIAPELKHGYLAAIRDLRRKRDEALRLGGDPAELEG